MLRFLAKIAIPIFSNLEMIQFLSIGSGVWIDTCLLLRHLCKYMSLYYQATIKYTRVLLVKLGVGPNMNEFDKMMHTLVLQCLAVLVSGVSVVGSAAPGGMSRMSSIRGKQPTLSGDGYTMLHPAIPRT